MSELEVLFPNGVQVSLKGETFQIKPFTLGQLPVVMSLMKSAAGPTQKALLGLNPGDGAILMSILAEVGTELNTLIAKVLKKDLQWVEEIEMDEAVQLIIALIDVNKDFFSKKVTPLISQRIQK